MKGLEGTPAVVRRAGDLREGAAGGGGLGPAGTPGSVLDLAEVLELAQVVEGAVVGALEALAAAFQAGEGQLGVLEGWAEHFVRSTVCHTVELVFPEMGYGFAETAEQPLGIDENVDEGALGGGLRLVIEEVLGSERVEGRGGFATDDLGSRPMLKLAPKNKPELPQTALRSNWRPRERAHELPPKPPLARLNPAKSKRHVWR